MKSDGLSIRKLVNRVAVEIEYLIGVQGIISLRKET